MFNLVAAGASYLALNSISISSIADVSSVAGQFAMPGGNPAKAIFSIISYLLKYIIPFIFIFAGIFSFTGRLKGNLKRKRLLNNVRTNDHLPYALSDLSWEEFELLIGQIFRERGYRVLEGPGTQDGGIDLTLKRGGKTHFVQCKHWRTSSVGVSVVRELFGVISLHRADGGYIVCSGYFTKAASDFAKKANVKLIGINELQKHLA